MKKIFVLIILLTFAGFSCKDECKIDKPSNVKIIDWENYNDAYTVYWNYTGDCSDFPRGEVGIIKMYGWIFHPENVNPYDFYLLNDSLAVEANNPKCAAIWMGCISEELDRLKIKLDTSDLTKKCYVTGKLMIMNLPNNDCCHTAPSITIMNADDVYFE